MSTSPTAIFNGNSRYSSDFQSIIDRTVAIDSLNLTQMGGVNTRLQNQSADLKTLQSSVSDFQSAVSQLSSALGSSSFQPNVSDPSVLTAAVAEGVQPSSYTIEVTSIGAAASTMSKTPGTGLGTVLNPYNGGFGATGPFQLFINNNDPLTITPASGSLNDLVTAINQASPNVHAAMVNVGGQSGPDYRLTIQSNHFSTTDTIQIKDAGGSDMLDPLVTGAPVTYRIDGGSVITNNTQTITLAPGLTVNLKRQSATGVADTITVAQGTDSVQNALTAFVQSFNTLNGTLNLHRGQSAGTLKGDVIINTVSNALRDITGYRGGSGAVSSLASLGLTFDKNLSGTLLFDPSTLATNTAGGLSDLSNFLGSATGGGFLGRVTGDMNSLEDSVSGALPTEINNLTAQISKQTNNIATQQARMDQFKSNLTARMAATDALIATMEQKITSYNGIFAAMLNSNSNNG